MAIIRGEAVAIDNALTTPDADSIAAISLVSPAARPHSSSSRATWDSSSWMSSALSVFGSRTMSAPALTADSRSFRPNGESSLLMRTTVSMP
jgi:hypothetical protein